MRLVKHYLCMNENLRFNIIIVYDFDEKHTNNYSFYRLLN